MVVVVDFQLPVQSVLIITKVVSSYHANGEVYSIQHYVIHFVSDLRQVIGSLSGLPPPIKLDALIKLKYCRYVVLCTINRNALYIHYVKSSIFEPYQSDYADNTY